MYQHNSGLQGVFDIWFDRKVRFQIRFQEGLERASVNKSSDSVMSSRTDELRK